MRNRVPPAQKKTFRFAQYKWKNTSNLVWEQQHDGWRWPGALTVNAAQTLCRNQSFSLPYPPFHISGIVHSISQLSGVISWEMEIEAIRNRSSIGLLTYVLLFQEAISHRILCTIGVVGGGGSQEDPMLKSY